MKTLALTKRWRYGLQQVVAKSAAQGVGTLLENLAHKQRPIRQQALFLCPLFCFMAAVCGQASAWPGSKFPGIPTPHTAATQSRRKDRGSSKNELGATPMHPVRNLSASHADAWKARALAALRSNSSLSVRLARYNAAMAKARALEAQEVRHA